MTSPPPSPPASAPPAKAGPWLKALLGCAIGCGALALLAVLAAGAGFWWLVSPGEQVATEGIAGGESLAVVHFAGLNDDPGVRELLTGAWWEMQRAADRRRAEESPEALRWLEEMGRAQSNPSGLAMWIPRELTVAVERGADGAPAYLVAVNLASFPRLIRTLVRQVARSAEGEVARERHRGYEIEVLGPGGALSFAGSTLLFASEPELMRRALDRLEDGPEPGSMTALAAAGTGDDRWDVRGALLDLDGGLGDLLAGLLPPAADPSPGAGAAPGAVRRPILEAPERPAGFEADAGAGGAGAAGPPNVAAEPPPPSAERATFGVDVVTGDRIEAELRLDCASAADAREWLARLDQAARRLESGHGALAARVDGTVEGAQLRAAIELTGVAGWLESAIAAWMAETADGGGWEDDSE